MVTSAIAGEGKSSIVRNLAFAYQESGLRVAVVDGDLRRSTLPALFGISPSPGLTDALSDGQDPREAMRPVPAPVGGSVGNGAPEPCRPPGKWGSRGSDKRPASAESACGPGDEADCHPAR